MFVTGKAACSLDILSPKKVRKVVASDELVDGVGSVRHEDLDNKVLRVFQSFRGCAACFVMSER
jgi:hypothetical protein